MKLFGLASVRLTEFAVEKVIQGYNLGTGGKAGQHETETGDNFNLHNIIFVYIIKIRGINV
jgi:hypothetical protein